ncbi:MAG TPA: exopolysaccharide biosynthesis protein [Aquihabitans sp.]|jgi:hypothetical protein|nr:exopolysaccharide biosynthesis protein [Aquihabitans sp.]
MASDQRDAATADEATPAPGQPVSDQLEEWLTNDEPNTMGSLTDAFGDEILAVACLVLVAPSALPIPTGGATDVLNVLALISAIQIAIGRRSLWVPKRWRDKDLGSRSAKFIGFLVRAIRTCEKVSRPRLSGLLASRPGRAVIGLAIAVFAIGAILAPPFSGLDTLPALGVVLITLGMLLGDAAFVIAGLVVGAGGIGLAVTLGAKAAEAIGNLFG